MKTIIPNQKYIKNYNDQIHLIFDGRYHSTFLLKYKNFHFLSMIKFEFIDQFRNFINDLMKQKIEYFSFGDKVKFYKKENLYYITNYEITEEISKENLLFIIDFLDDVDNMLMYLKLME